MAVTPGRVPYLRNRCGTNDSKHTVVIGAAPRASLCVFHRLYRDPCNTHHTNRRIHTKHRGPRSLAAPTHIHPWWVGAMPKRRAQDAAPAAPEQRCARPLLCCNPALTCPHASIHAHTLRPACCAAPLVVRLLHCKPSPAKRQRVPWPAAPFASARWAYFVRSCERQKFL